MNKVVVHSHKSRHQIEYDDNGNQEKMTDDTGETVRTYDELNRVISKNVGNISGEALYKYDILVFDGNDYLTAEVSVDNKGNEITKVYDKVGRLKYVVDDELVSGSSISSADSSKLTEYDYYDNGARESIRHPQFTEGSNTYRYRQTYNYRNDGLLNMLVTHKMEITANGETVDSQLERFQYYYDNAGNQTSKFEIVDGVVKGTTDFEYDDLNRLEKVTEPEGRETVYTFDAAGNRKTEAITESGATVNKIYHYNDKNWLEEVEVLGAETIEYDYDEDGNQTEVRKVENGVTEVRAEYKYDPLNRLIEAVTDTATVTYAYNGEGRRVEKSTGQETIYYLYEYDKVVLEVDGTGDQVARNLYGINLLMRDVDGDSYYYVYNGHADVTALIDANTGVVEATYYYDPFGNILESTGDVNNNIKYAGYQYDEETELYYLNARMYDPNIARFLQEDTYRGDLRDPLSLNLYTYCHNEPIMYFDPSGNTPIRQLVAEGNGKIDWNAEYKTAKVVLNGIEYSFQVNSDKSINLIKDNLIYGTFKTEEAKLVQYTNSYNQLVADIDIEDDVFGKYFGFWGKTPNPRPAPKPQPDFKTIFNTSTDNYLSGSAKMHIWNLDNLYGNLNNNYVPKAEAELIRTLDNAFSEQFNMKASLGNVFGNSTIDALGIINKYNEVVDKTSKEFNVSKEMIQSVLFREIRCFSPDDNLDWLKIRLRGDASIGLGQVLIRTAQVAERQVKGIERTRKEVEKRLWNNETNIEYVGMVLAHEGLILEINTQAPSAEILARYNGFGIEAERYGNETIVYADAFTNYNLVLEKNRSIK
jgi:RHS repeat-associated protein